MRNSTVHFDVAGPGIASLIKLAHWGETGCLLAQVLSNSRLGVAAHLDLVSAAGGEGQSSSKYYWLEGWSEHGCVSIEISPLHWGEGCGVNTNERGFLLYNLHPAALIYILDSHHLCGCNGMVLCFRLWFVSVKCV